MIYWKNRLTLNNKISIWGKMDDIIHGFKNKEIVKYWERNGIPKGHLKYKDIIVNRYWFEKYFKEMNFDECLHTFYKCIRCNYESDYYLRDMLIFEKMENSKYGLTEEE